MDNLRKGKQQPFFLPEHWTTLEKGASLRKKGEKKMKVSKVGLFLFT